MRLLKSRLLKRRSKRTYKSKRSPKVRAGYIASNARISAIVKRVLSRKAETKRVVYPFSMNPQVLQPSTSSLAGNYQIMTPSSASSVGYTIAQGTANNQRLGNKIQTKSLIFKYVLYPTSYNATTNTSMLPQEVIIYFFKSKSGPQTVLTASFDLPQLYDGGSSSTGPQGYLLDTMRKLNQEEYIYLTHRRHKVGKSIVGSTANLTAANYNSMQNNDFKANINGKVILTKHCPKQIVFPDSTSGPSNTAITPWIHCLVQTVAADGSVLSTS